MKSIFKVLFVLTLGFCQVDATDSVPLRYGDAIYVSHENNTLSFVLGTQVDSSGKVVIGAWAPLEPRVSAKMYVQPASATTRWGTRDIVTSGAYIRLEADYLSKSTPSWLGYDLSSNQKAVLWDQKTSFQANGPTGVVLKIIKTNTTTPDPIKSGDQVVFWGYSSTGLVALGTTKTPGGSLNADLFFSSTQTNPSTFSSNYCWKIFSSLIQASDGEFLPNTIPAAPPTTEQNLASWPQPPDLSNVTPLANPPLTYGDGFYLKHKTYGFYVATPNLSYSINIFGPEYGLFGSTNESNRLRFRIFNTYGTGSMAYKGNALGTPVRSGDFVSFDVDFPPLAANDAAHPNYRFLLSSCGMRIQFMLPPANIAPYYAAEIFPAKGLLMWYDEEPACGFRIFKKGAAVGDLIFPNDTIYLMSFVWHAGTNPYLIYSTNRYLGSDNRSFTVNGNSTYSAIYLYAGTEFNRPWYTLSSTPYTQTLPPNFTTDYLWIVYDVAPADYLNITGNPQQRMFEDSHMFNATGVFDGTVNPTYLQV